MTAFNVELHQNNGADFNDIIYLKTKPEMVDGLLNGGKITESLLPASVFGGMRFAGPLITNMDLGPSAGDVSALLDAFIAANGGSKVGVYWVATGNIELTEYNIAPYYFTWDVRPEEGDAAPIVTLEAGDWLIVTQYYEDTDPEAFYTMFSVINNTYQLASSSVNGLMSYQQYTKLAGIAENANNYSHPTQTAIDANCTDNGQSVIDRIQVNTLGHVTAVSTRNLSTASTTEPGLMSPTEHVKLGTVEENANYYIHATNGANVTRDLTTVETIDSISVNAYGHVTSVTKQTIRSATTALDGISRLATVEEMKAGTLASVAGTPAGVKAAIDFFATLPVYANQTAANTDAPNQPVGKLALVIV